MQLSPILLVESEASIKEVKIRKGNGNESYLTCIINPLGTWIFD